MRLVAAVLSLIVLVSTIASLSGSRPEPPVEALVPAGFQGELVLPSDEIEALISDANAEIRQRYESLLLIDRARVAVAITNAVLALVLALVAGFYGQIPRLGDAPSLEGIAGAQVRSVRVVRLLGMLVAAVTAFGVVERRIADELGRRSAGLDGLKDELLRTTEVIYDTDSTELQARTSVTRLRLELHEVP